MTELPADQLRLAVFDCLNPDTQSKSKDFRTLAYVIDRLWREDPAKVSAAYFKAVDGPTDGASQEGQSHGLHAERARALLRPLQSRDRKGVSLTAMATSVGLERETLAALLEHHGYIETSPYGRTQNRRLCSRAAFMAGIGHNVDPSVKRSPRLDGMAKAAPFPVFYAEHVHSIFWTLDWQGIVAAVSEQPGGKRGRIRFALGAYGYLPNAALAGLCAASIRGIEQARLRSSTQ